MIRNKFLCALLIGGLSASAAAADEVPQLSTDHTANYSVTIKQTDGEPHIQAFTACGPVLLEGFEVYVYDPGDSTFDENDLRLTVYDDSAGHLGQVMASVDLQIGSHSSQSAATHVDFRSMELVLTGDYFAVLTTAGSSELSDNKNILSAKYAKPQSPSSAIETEGARESLTDVRGTDVDFVITPYVTRVEPDTAFVFGLEHTSLGGACLDITSSLLTVSNIGTSGTDGVNVLTGPNDAFACSFDLLNPGVNAFYRVSTYGPTDTAARDELETLTIGRDSSQFTIVPQFNHSSQTQLTIKLYNDGSLTDSVIVSPGEIMTSSDPPTGTELGNIYNRGGTSDIVSCNDPCPPGFTKYTQCANLSGADPCRYQAGLSGPCLDECEQAGGAIQCVCLQSFIQVEFDTTTTLEIASQFFNADLIKITTDGLPNGNGYLTDVEITAAHIDTVVLASESVSLWGTPFESVGGAALLPSLGSLTLSNVDASGSDGVSIDVGETHYTLLTLEEIDFDTLADGAGLSLSYEGTLSGNIPGTIGACDITRQNDSLVFSADFSDIGADSVLVEVLFNDSIVSSYETTIPEVSVALAELPGGRMSVEHDAADSTDRPHALRIWFLTQVGEGDTALAGGVDEIRFYPLNDTVTTASRFIHKSIQKIIKTVTNLFPSLISILIEKYPCVVSTIEILSSASYPHNVGDQIAFAAAPTGLLPIIPYSFKWDIHGAPAIKDYYEKTDKPWQVVQLSPVHFRLPFLILCWLPETSQIYPNNSGPVSRTVSCRVKHLWGTCEAEVTFQVERNQNNINRQPVDFYTTNHQTKVQDDGRVIREHVKWHNDYPFRADYGDHERFFTFHRAFIDRYQQWRTLFGYGPVGTWDPGTPIPNDPEINHLNRDASYTLTPIPTWFTVSGGGGSRPDNNYPCDQGGGEQRLADFFSQDLLGCAVEAPWHNLVHVRIGGDMNRLESPVDGIFWRWHNFVDDISITAKSEGIFKTYAQYVSPFFLYKYLVEFPSEVVVEFDAPVTGVQPSNLTVSGSPATTVTGSASGPYVFTGYAPPELGPVMIAFDSTSVEDTAGAAVSSYVFTHVLIDSIGDNDADGLSNGEEVVDYGTNPENSDSDGDGVSDYDEIILGTDPLNHHDPSGCCNIRGDVSNSGTVNVSDLTYLVDFLFSGGANPPCEEEGDVNADGTTNISDLTYLVDFLFSGGSAPPAC